MSTVRKYLKYPRARISRHPNLNGWVIDLIQRAGAKPNRVAATYASIVWADRAARLKLGLDPSKPLAAARIAPLVPKPEFVAFQRPDRAQQSDRSPNGVRATGTCEPCGRPMRPAGSRAADYPGTTLRQREGLCQPCNQKTKRVKQ